MRRPLCLVCLAFVVMISILQIWIQVPSESYEVLEGKTIQLSGHVYSKQIKNDKQVIYLKNIQWENKKQNTEKMQVMCYLEKGNVPKIGSIVQLEGMMKSFAFATNPGEFDQNSYYQVLNMSFQVQNSRLLKGSKSYDYHGEFLYKIREKLKGVVDSGLPEKEAGIVNAMMLGDKGDLDQEVKGLYQRSGMSHILAISGLHITLLGMGFYKLIRRSPLPLPICAILSILFMYEYGKMTGFGTSTVRAVFMFAIHLVGQLIGRTYDLITAMAIACVVLLCSQPLYVRHSGFLLSFGAVMGIALVNPQLQKWNPWNASHIIYLSKLVQSFLASISITLTTLPILLYFFYEYPIYSVFLNLLIIPLMTILFLFGVLGLMVGIFSPLGSYILFLPCYLILIIYEKAALLLEKIPGGRMIIGRPENWQIICYYILLIGAIYMMEYHLFHFRQQSIILLMVGLLLLSGSFGRELSITMLDIGQGDALVVQTLDGKTFLIDGGSSSKKNIGTYQIIPFLKYNGISNVDYLFISHMDSDHISGIVELMEMAMKEGITLQNIVVSQYAIRDDTYTNVVKMAKKNGITVRGMKGGERLVLGEVELNCLYPYEGELYENSNSSSMVLELVFNSFRGIFMGDLEESKEEKVLEVLSARTKKGKAYDLLKVSHHGSNNSSSKEFLEYIRPQLSIISCGKKNRYGHPGKETMKRLQDVKSKVMTTPIEGAIQIQIAKDGKKMLIKSYRK